jgi:acylphosphatase
MSKHLNLKIYGKVQGVLFRASAQMLARKLELTGFARNENDGSVYIEIEGEDKNLEKYVDWCQLGPKSAQVSNVEIKKDKLKNFTQFDID